MFVKESPEEVLTLVLLLSTLDAIATLQGISLGVYVESNPIMAWLIENSYYAFFLAKFAMVAAGLAVLGYHWKKKIAQVGVIVVLGVYLTITIVHVRNVTELVL